MPFPQILRVSQLVLEIPCISCNPNVHDHAHNSLPLVPTLSQVSPLHTPNHTSLGLILILSSIYTYSFLMVSCLQISSLNLVRTISLLYFKCVT